MAIAIFGKKTFQVSGKRIYTFNDFTLGSQLNTESQDVAGKKPSTYIKGADLNSMAFSIPLDASLNVNVRAEYENWEAIKDAGIAYPFILGGRPISRNKWLLKNVDLSDVQIDLKGNMLKAILKVQFEEYVRPGSAKSTTGKGSGSVKKKAPAVRKEQNVNKNVANNLLAGDKYSKKRENRNMYMAMKKGLV